MSSETAIAQVANYIRESRATVAFTGAGISTPSGIPDFRSPTSGLWEKVNPMAVASLFGFRQNPRAFYDWVYPLAQKTLAAQPNAAHIALAHLETVAHLIAIITQNIDMLHQRAGSSQVYELHGQFREATCTHCFTPYPGLPLLEQFLTDRKVPHCPRCGGVIKPNVILFGEQLPLQVLRAAQDVARRADLMLIVGSSLEVAPASDIPIIATRSGAKLVIINLEPTDFDQGADVVIHEDAAIVLPEIMRYLESTP
ncbi:MAG: NAD-dependent deacylase [Anaerolineae bacterium]|nr:NAD-dependent deacylase [Anaerolineae bacterium]